MVIWLSSLKKFKLNFENVYAQKSYDEASIVNTVNGISLSMFVILWLKADI